MEQRTGVRPEPPHIRAGQELARQGHLLIAEEFGVTEIKSKGLIEKLGKLVASNILNVTDASDNKPMLPVRNLPHADVSDAEGLNPLGLLRRPKFRVTQAPAM